MRKQTPIESRVHTLVLNVKLGTPPPGPWLPVPDAFYHTALHLQLPPCKFIFHASESYSSLANPGIIRFSAYWGSTSKRAEWRLTDSCWELMATREHSPAWHGRLQVLTAGVWAQYGDSFQSAKKSQKSQFVFEMPQAVQDTDNVCAGGHLPASCQIVTSM